LETKILATENFDGVYLQLISKDPELKILFDANCNDNTQGNPLDKSGKVKINSSGKYCIHTGKKIMDTKLPTGNPGTIKSLNDYSFVFNFNKATGKKITLANQPSSNYPGDGAFTLVNGIQNKNGLLRASEFIAFKGDNCEAIIDLGKTENISKVTVHTLHQKESWIWSPAAIEIFGSLDGKSFSSLGLTDVFTQKENNTGTMTVNLVHTANTRYLKVLAKNRGPIPDNEPGDGNPSWLFVDEIEVQ